MYKLKTFITLLFSIIAVTSCAYSPKKGEGYNDVAYGEHERHVYDVYVPSNAINAPVIFMVHGGAWRAGDKTNRRVVKYKVRRWLPKGVVFISTNYRLLPDADPIEQAKDVAKAIAHAQHNAAQYGANPNQFVLMGHSAGAHLVALLNSDFSIAREQGAMPWLGTVSIDSAAFDMEKVMQNDPAWFYRKAFGESAQFWRDASPYHRLKADQKQKSSPLLAICSTTRPDKPCNQVKEYANKARSLDLNVQMLPVNLNHTEANAELGQGNEYTDQVEAFLSKLHSSFSQVLSN